jgi:Deoxyribonuclease NucA/NucB
MTHPVLKIDALKYEELADNIWHAQMNGHPLVLTYAGPFLGRQNRKDAMHFEMDGVKQEIMHLLSRDEYPFACTLEGGKSAWVGHIPGKQNSAQGGLIGSFLRQEAIVPYDRTASKNVQEQSRFKVEVINHRYGPVVVKELRTPEYDLKLREMMAGQKRRP